MIRRFNQPDWTFDRERGKSVLKGDGGQPGNGGGREGNRQQKTRKKAAQNFQHDPEVTSRCGAEQNEFATETDSRRKADGEFYGGVFGMNFALACADN